MFKNGIHLGHGKCLYCFCCTVLGSHSGIISSDTWCGEKFDPLVAAHMHFSGEFRESHHYKTISSREMCFLRANEAAHLVNGQKEQFQSAASGQVAEIKSVCCTSVFPVQ